MGPHVKICRDKRDRMVKEIAALRGQVKALEGAHLRARKREAKLRAVVEAISHALKGGE